MIYHPFLSNIVFVNDLDDFKLPYRLQSRTDLENMTDKYNRIRKSSQGYIIRLGIAEKRQW